MQCWVDSWSHNFHCSHNWQVQSYYYILTCWWMSRYLIELIGCILPNSPMDYCSFLDCFRFDCHFLRCQIPLNNSCRRSRIRCLIRSLIILLSHRLVRCSHQGKRKRRSHSCRIPCFSCFGCPRRMVPPQIVENCCHSSRWCSWILRWNNNLQSCILLGC